MSATNHSPATKHSRTGTRSTPDFRLAGPGALGWPLVAERRGLDFGTA